MGEDKAFFLSLTAYCYVLSALSKEKRIPMQGRRKNELFAGVLDFDGIAQFAQAFERAQRAPMQTASAQGLRVEKQAGERVAIFVWNDVEHAPSDDRADTVLRLCLGADGASLRTDHPRDTALLAATAQLLEKLCQTD